MRLEDAAELATRISQTWPRGVNTSVWEEVLLDLDDGAAGTTYVRLRSTDTHAPSIARFLDTYRAVRAAQLDPTPRSRCLQCDGTGWERAVDFVRSDESGEECYRASQVAPCRLCDLGEEAARTRMSVLRANGHIRPKEDAA